MLRRRVRNASLVRAATDSVAWGYASGATTQAMRELGYDPTHGVACTCRKCVQRFGHVPAMPGT